MSDRLRTLSRTFVITRVTLRGVTYNWVDRIVSEWRLTKTYGFCGSFCLSLLTVSLPLHMSFRSTVFGTLMSLVHICSLYSLSSLRYMTIFVSVFLSVIDVDTKTQTEITVLAVRSVTLRPQKLVTLTKHKKKKEERIFFEGLIERSGI